MKRFFLLILLFISILKVLANPLPAPHVEISELQFRADGSWILEIDVSSFWTKEQIGSLWIKSNSGEAKLKLLEDDSYYGFLIVENDSLETPLSINPLQDSISIRREWGDSYIEFSEMLTYGYPNSKIRTPRVGQSIARIPGTSLFSICNSPTIGLENNIYYGMMGTIKGTIYDHNGLPFINKGYANFFFSYYWGLIFLGDQDNCFVNNDFYFKLYPDGSYSTMHHSSDYNDVNFLAYKGSCFYPIYYTANITPISFSMQPDSVVIQDIYLTDDIFAGINETDANAESILKIYPQPIKQQSLNYEISIPIKSLETYLVFRNINGQEIYRFSVTENKGVITLPESIKNGSYIVQLLSNKKSYSTTKIIVQ